VSLRAALESPVVHFYLALVFGLLLVAGLPLALFRNRAGRVWQTYRGWLVIVPVTAIPIVLGRETAILLFIVVALLAVAEFTRATGLAADRGLTGGVFAGVIAVGVAALVPDPAGSRPGWYGLFMSLPVFVTAGLLAVPVVRDGVRGQLHAVTLAVFAFLYFWMFGHLAFLCNADHAYAYVGYLVFAVEINDIAAFVAGRLFGRRPLRPTVSPKKTWEGAAGALMISLALPWAVWFTFPHFAPIDLLVVGLVVGVGGQVGDLAMSVIKRDLGVKDLGSAIPGHGGVLDRIDSLTYVAPLFFHYVRFRFGLAGPP
jgi:phosphatidate cytidylyltransferase